MKSLPENTHTYTQELDDLDRISALSLDERLKFYLARDEQDRINWEALMQEVEAVLAKVRKATKNFKVNTTPTMTNKPSAIATSFTTTIEAFSDKIDFDGESSILLDSTLATESAAQKISGTCIDNEDGYELSDREIAIEVTSTETPKLLITVVYSREFDHFFVTALHQPDEVEAEPTATDETVSIQQF